MAKFQQYNRLTDAEKARKVNVPEITVFAGESSDPSYCFYTNFDVTQTKTTFLFINSYG